MSVGDKSIRAFVSHETPNQKPSAAKKADQRRHCDGRPGTADLLHLVSCVLEGEPFMDGTGWAARMGGGVWNG